MLAQGGYDDSYSVWEDIQDLSWIVEGDSEEPRTVVRRLRLTPTEAATLDARVAESGHTMSQFIRDVLAL